MSKLKCKCGHVILDQSEISREKLCIVQSADLEKYRAALFGKIDTLILASEKNNLQEWIRQNFTVPPYPTNLQNTEMLSDLEAGFASTFFKTVYKCSKCERLWLQSDENSDIYIPYQREI